MKSSYCFDLIRKSDDVKPVASNLKGKKMALATDTIQTFAIQVTAFDICAANCKPTNTQHNQVVN